MTISIPSLTVSRYQYYYSNPFLIPTSRKNSYTIVTSDDDVSLQDRDGFTLGGTINPSESISAVVVIRPNASTMSKKYTITLVADKGDNIDISGGIVVPGTLETVPALTINSALNTSLNGNTIRALATQDTPVSTIRILSSSISWTDGAVSDFSISSITNNSSDLFIARSAISLNCSTAGGLLLTVTLNNPNATKSINDYLGFSRDTAFDITFYKDILLNGKSYVLNFALHLEFKGRQVIITDKRCQTAMIDKFHQKTLVSYDFTSNVDLSERQIMIGSTSMANIPTRFSYEVPDATKVSGITGRYSLSLSIIAQSCTKGPNSYSLKFVILTQLPASRSLVSQKTEIPITMKANGFKHQFSIPVVING